MDLHSLLSHDGQSKLDYEKGKDGYLVESWERGKKKKRDDDDGGEEDVTG